MQRGFREESLLFFICIRNPIAEAVTHVSEEGLLLSICIRSRQGENSGRHLA